MKGPPELFPNNGSPAKVLILQETLYDPMMPVNVRTADLCIAWSQCGHDVHLLSQHGPVADDFREPMHIAGVHSYFAGDEDLELIEFLSDGEWDVIVIYLWYWYEHSLAELYLFLLQETNPQAKIVMMTDDVHGHRAELIYEAFRTFPPLEKGYGDIFNQLRHASGGEAVTGPLGIPHKNSWQTYFPHHFSKSYVQDLFSRENMTYTYADFIITATESDLASVNRIYRDRAEHPVTATTGVLHFAHNLTKLALPNPSELIPFHSRLGIMFVGYGGNPTNRLALEWYFSQVYPLLKGTAMENVPYYLIGSIPEDGHSSLFASGARIILKGKMKKEFLVDFASFVRLSICPSVAATGIITKILFSLNAGVPVVATSVGAQGLRWEGAEHEALFARAVKIGDTATAFAQRMLEAYMEETVWNDMLMAGIGLMDAQIGASPNRFEEECKMMLPYCSPRDPIPMPEEGLGDVLTPQEYVERKEKEAAAEAILQEAVDEAIAATCPQEGVLVSALFYYSALALIAVLSIHAVLTYDKEQSAKNHSAKTK